MPIYDLNTLVELRRKRNEELYKKSKESAKSIGGSQDRDLDKYDKRAMDELGRTLTAGERRNIEIRNKLLKQQKFK